MKRAYSICAIQILTATFMLSQSNPVHLVNQSVRVAPPISASQSDQKVQARILNSYGKLPLSFEANKGQTDPRVMFLSRTSGYTLFLTGDEAVLAFSGKKATNTGSKTPISSPIETRRAASAGKQLRMKLRNANPSARVTGLDELVGTSNYFIGSDPAKWQTSVPTFAKVEYEGIYSGIDLVYYGNQRQLEYDFIVAPGSDPRRIQFDVRGANRIRRDGNGELVFKMGEGEILWHKPLVYQKKDATRQEIATQYTITNTNRVGFAIAKYDASRPLYIDPLIYSTYLGGSAEDVGYGIAVDSTGNAYVSGSTGSADFPATQGAFQTTCCGAFITKLNSTGTALVYSTYLGGSGGASGTGIALDSSTNAYLTGSAGADFPVTAGAFQTTYGGDGNAFVAEINSTGSALVYSTYLGGSGGDAANGIALDGAGNAYVTGETLSPDFPITEGAFQTVCNGFGLHRHPCFDAFVTKLNPTGSALDYSTYLGGSGGNDDGDGGNYGSGIAVDGSGNAYVTGQTGSRTFPTTLGVFQPSTRSHFDAFVTKFNSTGSLLIYSTYLGGNNYDQGRGITLDSSGNVYVTGQTGSSKFPTTLGAFQSTCGSLRRPINCANAFVTELNPTGSDLVYSTYLGGNGVGASGNGIAVDSSGNAYVTGSAGADFPVTSGAFQTTYGGNNDAFVTKIQPVAGPVATSTSLTSVPNPATEGQAVAFTATISSVNGAPPDGETVSFMRGKTALGTGTLSGGSASFTTSTLKVGTTTVTAVYGGDPKLAGSKSSVRQVVDTAIE